MKPLGTQSVQYQVIESSDNEFVQNHRIIDMLWVMCSVHAMADVSTFKKIFHFVLSIKTQEL